MWWWWWWWGGGTVAVELDPAHGGPVHVRRLRPALALTAIVVLHIVVPEVCASSSRQRHHPRRRHGQLTAAPGRQSTHHPPGGRAGSVRTQRPAPAAPAGPTARNHQCDAARETRFEQQAKQQGAEGRGGARGSEGEGTGRGGQGLGWRTAASIGIRAAVAGSIPLRCRSPRRPTAALPSPTKLPLLVAFHLPVLRSVCRDTLT